MEISGVAQPLSLPIAACSLSFPPAAGGGTTTAATVLAARVFPVCWRSSKWTFGTPVFVSALVQKRRSNHLFIGDHL